MYATSGPSQASDQPAYRTNTDQNKLNLCTALETDLSALGKPPLFSFQRDSQRFEECLRGREPQARLGEYSLGKRKKGQDRPRSAPNPGAPGPPPGTRSWVKKSRWKRNSIILGIVLIVIIVGAYSLSQTGASARPIQVVNSAWKNASLTDANTGKNFTLAQFAGKVVVLQFMAVYCQYCLAESHQLVSVQQTFASNGHAAQVIIVSVDVDPNENLAYLQQYVNQNHFGAPSSDPVWYFAKDNTGQLLQSVVGSVDFSSFISQTNMYFIDKSQSSTLYTMQRTSLQDANPATDIVAAAQKLF
jgi:thiol-disulfide isomerase/thioredoxin